jgi:hypothetical protein
VKVSGDLSLRLLNKLSTGKRIQTFIVSRIARNFLRSPISMQLLIHGSASLTLSSRGTGATFSPPAVINSSEINQSQATGL